VSAPVDPTQHHLHGRRRSLHRKPLAPAGVEPDRPWRRSVADVLFGTMVINVPPPQPHRASAAPMYSPDDAEFGLRPRRISR